MELKNMSNELSLRYREKILIYLEGYTSLSGDEILPEDITQAGIAEALDMSRTHASRVLKSLVSEQLLQEKKSRIKGKNRKLKTYRLTQEGIKRAEEILAELESEEIAILNNDKKNSVKLTTVEEKTDGKVSLVSALTTIEAGKNKIDLRDMKPTEPIKIVDESLESDELVGREEQLESLHEWLKGDAPISVLYGRKGSGTSSLASQFIESVEDRHICWINASKHDFDEIKRILDDFLNDISDADKENWETDGILKKLLDSRSLIVFDDYYDVSDELVDFLTDVVEQIGEDQLKLLTVCRVGTPMYERFYTVDDVKRGMIEEIKVPPLNKEEAESLLGSEIQEEALERIMLLTQGSPQILKRLRKGDEEEIEEISTLEKDQISLLMFLKRRTKD